MNYILSILLIFLSTQIGSAQSQFDNSNQVEDGTYLQMSFRMEGEPAKREVSLIRQDKNVVEIKYGNKTYKAENNFYPRYFEANWSDKLSIIDGVIYIWHLGGQYKNEPSIDYMGFSKKVKKNIVYHKALLKKYWEDIQKPYEKAKSNATPGSLEFADVKSIKPIIKDANSSTLKTGNTYIVGAEITLENGTKRLSTNIGGDVDMAELKIWTNNFSVGKDGELTMYLLTNVTNDQFSEKNEILRSGEIKVSIQSKFSSQTYSKSYTIDYTRDMSFDLNTLTSKTVGSADIVYGYYKELENGSKAYGIQITLKTTDSNIEYFSFSGQSNRLGIHGEGTANRPEGIDVRLVDHLDGSGSIKINVAGKDGARDGVIK